MTTTLTNDQITAGAAVLAIPTAILHLPCNRTMSHFATVHEMNSYKEGHRDARHAAADLVLARADELKALAAPSPQVADIAELPPLKLMPKPHMRLSEAEGSEDYPVFLTAHMQSYAREYARDAIAASRRAKRPMPPELQAAIAEAHKTGATSALASTGESVFINYGHDLGDNAHLECTACGGSGHIEDQQASATTAPASAGQAAQALPESLKGMAVSVDVSTCDEDGGNRIFAELTGETGSDGTTLLAIETSRNFAAQPAEGAGQAGQVALSEGMTNEQIIRRAIAELRALAPQELRQAGQVAKPELSVWEGAMPESNGKSNFTAVLHRKDAEGFDIFTDGFTISRSEYPDRVRYEADKVRWIIGQRENRPELWDEGYDFDEHSGYVKPDAK